MYMDLAILAFFVFLYSVVAGLAVHRGYGASVR